MNKFVSRGGEKLQFAIEKFSINPKGFVCADFGSSTGGFTDCLLQNGAKKVYAVDNGYGVLDWKLRNDERVVCMERTNAMFVNLAEKVDLIVIDAGWTRQSKILPAAKSNIKSDGIIISLIKPHYEADKSEIFKGKVLEEQIDNILNRVKIEIDKMDFDIIDIVESPIKGARGYNIEFLVLLKLKSGK